jgi:hypothetical protein
LKDWAELSPKILKEDAEFLINLYFSLKKFNPQTSPNIENHNNSTLSKKLQYMSPVINILAKKNGSSFFKWGGNSQTLIPESFKPILQQFIDNKFKLEHNRIKSDLYHSGNINQAISDFEEISFAREPIIALKTKSRIPDPIDDIKYECFRKFLLGFAGFIGLCGGLMMAQISNLPEASWYFQSSGIMFFIVSAVSVYISRKI